MNHEDNEKSHAWTWLLAFVALPLVYLLSVPPVVLMTWRLTNPASPPSWVKVYSVPFGLLEKTALKGPLDFYVERWARLFGYSYRPTPNHE